ncbi:DUF4288 domain-containing protein [Pseudonocardia endophytica]|uniref:Uncharacterized protein DUF4288 n=1 Tax=Pseudonocardia endophytica TaxID=401976 RepID=A0A4R1HKG8_PSEEN|nr:DUF4288 domain-containing protein [Pseudonocardia endophytica]TCK20995.1 uncharacterized protein DUF4288 [Pseudonocardia endophytica]
MSSELRVYVAVLLFESTAPTPPGRPPLYREDVTLVHATTEDEAREAAERHARDQESTYEAASGDVVTLRFRQVVDLAPALTDDYSGTADLYCRHFRGIGLYRRWEPMLSGEPV